MIRTSRSNAIVPSPTISQAQRGRRYDNLKRLLLLAGLAVAIVLGSILIYTRPWIYELPIGYKLGIPTNGLGDVESGENGTFRWTGPATRIRFPGIGQATHEITIEFFNPVQDRPRTLALSVGQTLLGSVALEYGWQRVRIIVPASRLTQPSADLSLRLQTDPALITADRQLGIALRALQIRQMSPAIVPFYVVMTLLGIGALLMVMLAILGLGWRWMLIGAAGGSLLLLVQLMTARVDAVVLLPILTRSLGIGLFLSPFLRIWVSLQPAPDRHWAARLALVAVSCFIVRFTGMQHPKFIEIDHTLRVHQIQTIAGGNRAAVQARLGHQYEWGDDIVVPYSLLSYDIFVPLAHLLDTQQLSAALEGTTAMLDASVVLLLWHLARQSGSDIRSSWWSGALYALFPVGYLYFHDGSYPTIIGLWASTITLMLLSAYVTRPRWWLWAASVAAIAISILMYVTQLAFVPLLLGSVVLSIWFFATGQLRQTKWLLALATACGLLIALLGYYGSFLPTLFTTTIPSYIATIGREGSVGRDPTLLPGRLLGNPVEQLWGHYRIVGVLFAAVGVALALLHRDRWTTHLIIAYAVFLGLTTIIDLRFGLWNKHMYFALPGVCLAVGPVLGKLQSRGWSGRIVAFGFAGYLLWAGLSAWWLRVIWYIWSLETL